MALMKLSPKMANAYRFLSHNIRRIPFRGILLAGGLLLLLSQFGWSQSVKFYVNQTELTTDDNLVLSVEVGGIKGGSVRIPNWPNIEGFQPTGSSQRQNWINGRASVTFSRTYLPTRPGKFTIPKLSYRLERQTYNQKPIRLTVKKGTGRRKQPQARNPFDDFFRSPLDDFFGRKRQDPQQMEFKEVDADYFLSVNLNQDTAYVGEQVRGEVVLYINERDRGKIGVDGQAIMEMQQRIKNSGFWQEIIEFDQIPMSRVQINGKNYLAYTLYRTVLFPLASGTIAFKDIYLDGKKLMVATNASPFDSFFGKNTKYEALRIPANKRTLVVKSLPPTDLPNASMVGKFKMSAELNHAAVNTGDNLELNVQIKGDGNIAMMPPPATDFPEEFNSDEPNSAYKSRTTKTSFYGEKDFKYYLVPRRNGDYNLGPLKFFYFDPREKRYDSLVVDDIPIAVQGEDLDNLMLKQSGLDRFYESALSEAEEQVRRQGGGGTLIFLGVILLVAGAFTFRFVRQKNAAAQVIEEEPDPWKRRA